jgi:hypothetical protein
MTCTRFGVLVHVAEQTLIEVVKAGRRDNSPGKSYAIGDCSDYRAHSTLTYDVPSWPHVPSPYM